MELGLISSWELSSDTPADLPSHRVSRTRNTLIVDFILTPGSILARSLAAYVIDNDLALHADFIVRLPKTLHTLLQASGLPAFQGVCLYLFRG